MSAAGSSRLRRVIDLLRQDPEVPGLEEHVRRGIPVLVSNTRPDISTEAALARLDEALRLIEAYTPERFAVVAAEFSAILVRRYPCRAAYYPNLGVCLIELTFLVHRDITAAQVAASIVHESVHAASRAEGVQPDSLPAAAAEERRCRQAEIDFGLKVPGGEAVVERARAALQLADPDVAPVIDWQLAAERVAEADRRGSDGSP
ncbi:MAG: hypothetical protein AB7L66_21610 [Gemmatimonadales bacterium]